MVALNACPYASEFIYLNIKVIRYSKSDRFLEVYLEIYRINSTLSTYHGIKADGLQELSGL
ncbi:MAG: hypothetical protein DRQ49_11420 [Gammaproteobacteria bacterium]|nr:MAG: hypothetical protein DRQ49_11420 [Gammaproteobacteria bacterium]RKZ73175.1 MAG: hypothetical protein DRQ57_15195 [Gammaproteobacteria bacterium]